MEHVQVHTSENWRRQVQDNVQNPRQDILKPGEVPLILAGQKVVDVQHKKHERWERKRQQNTQSRGTELHPRDPVRRILRQAVGVVENIKFGTLSKVNIVPCEQREPDTQNTNDTAREQRKPKLRFRV